MQSSTLKKENSINSLKLDDLMNYSKDELDELFLQAETPTIEEINGITNGRVLTGIFPLVNPYFRYILNLPFIMPWRGKFFQPIDSKNGEGINRIEFGIVKFRMFRFETQIIEPIVGPNKVFSLNYDLPENPWFIRIIRDDVKRLRQGLYLGTANLQWKSDYYFILYFALEL
ncbi:MAG: hypothetical protein HQK77_13030 [Desulfobacterales bacterium]|nr:hypothetical protein [Desulfobacterales bacterium]